MLSKRIRELRFSLGLNQVQFGQAFNVTKQTISNWENDNIQPSVEMLIKIVNTYSVSADYLLGINERKPLMFRVISRADCSYTNDN